MGNKLLTNFHESKRYIYEEAIFLTEETSLFIAFLAFDKNGNALRKTNALWTSEPQKDYTNFWSIFRKCEARANLEEVK